jgi:hypothetical protein
VTPGQGRTEGAERVRKRPHRALLAGGAVAATAALTLDLSAIPSIATTAPTWTVKPGGTFAAANTGLVTVRDATTGTEITCTPSSLAGRLKSGNGLSGVKIASITKFSFSGCVGPAGIMFTVTTTASKTHPWKLTAKSYDTANGEATAALTGIAGGVRGFGCMMTFADTTAASPGMVKVRYTNNTHKLQVVTSGSTLHFYNAGAGCQQFFWDTGDHMTISGTFTVTPPQTITSP